MTLAATLLLVVLGLAGAWFALRWLVRWIIGVMFVWVLRGL